MNSGRKCDGPHFRSQSTSFEGCARRHRDDRLRFLDISRGSLAEVGYCLHVARQLEYISVERYAVFEKSLNQLGAALSGFINAVRDGRAV
jgi:four helix bundle protein